MLTCLQVSVLCIHIISIVNLWKLFQETGRAGLEDLPSVYSVHHVLPIILRKYS